MSLGYRLSPFLLVTACLILVGCQDDHLDVYEEQKAPRPPAAMGRGEPPAAEAGPVEATLTWTAPGSWTASEGAAMRLASFKAGQADVSVIRLVGDGGGLLANVNRWLGQIAMPPTDAAGLAAVASEDRCGVGEMTVVALFNPNDPAVGILAAAIPHQGSTWSLKMSGPSQELQQREAEFLAFARSVRTP